MQPKITQTLHDTTISSPSNQIVSSHHGSIFPHLRSVSSNNSHNEKYSRSQFSKHDYDSDKLRLENVTQYDQSHRTCSDNRITSPSHSIQHNSTSEDILLTSLLETNEKSGINVNPEKKYTRNTTTLEKIPNEVLTQILSHLPASSISNTALVSKKFNSLVTTPHVWHAAFNRIFRRLDINEDEKRHSDKSLANYVEIHLGTCHFCRLTVQASWRSEYLLRTQLLCCLARGKPAQGFSTQSSSSRHSTNARIKNSVFTYGSHLTATVNHIHAIFDSEKINPQFIHGSTETNSATTSDPVSGKIGKWELSETRVTSQFAEVWASHQPYGLNDGPARIPNSMDVSQLYGVIIGEGFPGGKTFYQSSNEMRGRYLGQAFNLRDFNIGIPRIPESIDAVSAVWIAKSHSIPRMTNGLIGMLCGSTLGVVTAYSSGFNNIHVRSIPEGFVTAKWVLSPGVPIIAFDIDDSYNSMRKARGRIWAVALNALGEVFYLNQTLSSILSNGVILEDEIGHHAWNTGRTVRWHMIPTSCRVFRDDPYQSSKIQTKHSPRSSSNDLNLSQNQLKDETLGIETYLHYTPVQFRKAFDDWDMRRRLYVDFAGDDGNGAGEAIFVIKCGISPGQRAEIKSMTRTRSNQELIKNGTFSQAAQTPLEKTVESQTFDNSLSCGASSVSVSERWQSSILSLRDNPFTEITCSAVDMSKYALLTVDEDPMSFGDDRCYFASSNKAYPNTTDMSIPGNRARFLVIGTRTGSLLIWNMRSPRPTNLSITNELLPLRKICTDSPEISCLAVSALYIVHGGSDGLVQAWDPLGSKLQPIRTFHSRFSSQARRRLARSRNSLDFNNNIYAAGAILLDPDPTRLRGMVSIGTQLRYWNYSSSTADELLNKKHKRRLHERVNNSSPDRFNKNGRGAMRDYITTEQEHMMEEQICANKQMQYLRGRFGVGICGLTEEEAIRYAELVSAEEFEKKQQYSKAENSFPPGCSGMLPETSSSG